MMAPCSLNQRLKLLEEENHAKEDKARRARESARAMKGDAIQVD
jgi:hypothetical protein